MGGLRIRIRRSLHRRGRRNHSFSSRSRTACRRIRLWIPRDCVPELYRGHDGYSDHLCFVGWNIGVFAGY
jgi:hypothetical protein